LEQWGEVGSGKEPSISLQYLLNAAVNSPNPFLLGSRRLLGVVPDFWLSEML